MYNIEIFKELQKFNGVLYEDVPHTYFYKDIQLVSTTTFLGRFSSGFDSEFISSNKAGGDIEVQQRLLKEWDYANLKGIYKGSLIHNYIEHFYSNKIMPYALEQHSKLNSITFADIEEEYKICLKYFHNFYEKTKHFLIPLCSELVMYDLKFGIGGMMDQLFYNIRTQQIEVFDWKTNKKIDKENRFNNFKHPFRHLTDSKWNAYSFQLRFYKKILERNTNLKIGQSYIVHFNESNDNFKIFKCNELNEEIKLIEETLDKNYDSKTKLNKLTSFKIN